MRHRVNGHMCDRLKYITKTAMAIILIQIQIKNFNFAVFGYNLSALNLRSIKALWVKEVVATNNNKYSNLFLPL